MHLNAKSLREDMQLRISIFEAEISIVYLTSSTILTGISLETDSFILLKQLTRMKVLVIRV